MIEQHLNKIYNMDCLEFMKTLPDKCIDLVLTDPPYRNEEDNQPTKDMRKNGGMKNFGGKPTKEYLDEIFRISKNQIIFGANNFELPPYKGFIVWEKGIPFDFTMSMAEIAYISEGLGTVSKIFTFRIAGAETRFHTTQKPIELMAKIIQKYSKEGETIFDPYLGSGSTAIACKMLKRNYIGCEISPEYCKIAEDRIKNISNTLF